MKLHPIVHDNRSRLWCGPAAIALVTGQPTSVIHRLAHEWRARLCQRKPVQGMSTAELEFIMGRLGFAVAERLNPVMPVFGVVQCIAFAHDFPAIACTHDHWFVVWRCQYADNHYGPQGFAPGNVAMDRVWDMATWKRVADPQLPAPRPIAPSRTREMREAGRLAKEFGITIELEKDVGNWYVHCPDEVDEVDDILEDDHYATTPAEVLDKVRQYVELVKHVRVHGELC